MPHSKLSCWRGRSSLSVLLASASPTAWLRGSPAPLPLSRLEESRASPTASLTGSPALLPRCRLEGVRLWHKHRPDVLSC
eukprot:366511-Chlamydomonas_euryale.AAC.5